jgi:hypothetical protein
MAEAMLGGVERVVELCSRSRAVQATTSSVLDIRNVWGDDP